MKLSTLKEYWPFSTRPDVDAEERLPSSPQSMAFSDVSVAPPKACPATASEKPVPEARPQLCPSTVSTGRVQVPRSDTLSANRVPLDNPRTASQRAGIGKRPRRKRCKIGQLYDDGETNKAKVTASVHAACLLLDVALTRPHLVGTDVLSGQLRRWYAERVARDGGKVQSWILIAKELTEWTVRRRRSPNGKKRTYYKIPPITPELKKCAAISHSLPKPPAEAA